MGLLYEQVDDGSWVYDTNGLACVVSNDGDTIYKVEGSRVIVPRIDYVNDEVTLARAEALIWAGVFLKDLPSISVGQALEGLQRQVAGWPMRLYCKSQGLGEEAVRVAGLAYQLSGIGEADILVGLPDPEALGYHLRDTLGEEGFVVFPGSIAAVRVTA